jgi:hypothetical protein
MQVKGPSGHWQTAQHHVDNLPLGQE